MLSSCRITSTAMEKSKSSGNTFMYVEENLFSVNNILNDNLIFEKNVMSIMKDVFGPFKQILNIENSC